MIDSKLMTRAADNIRILAASMVEQAKSGHPGGAMGGADFVNVLFSKYLVTDPDNPTWFARDRFFLDPGHMSPMLYSVLHLAGYYTTDDIKAFVVLQELVIHIRFHSLHALNSLRCYPEDGLVHYPAAVCLEEFDGGWPRVDKSSIGAFACLLKT